MRLLQTTAWILAGAGLTGAAYWGFLNTPESTVFALATSALLVVLALALLSITINGAIALWIDGPSSAGSKKLIAAIPAVVPALLIFALFWWIAHRIDTSIALRSGGINAWFIAAFGWDDVSWLFTGMQWFTTWLRWVIGGLLAVSLMGALAMVGWHAAAHASWLRRPLRPRALITGTICFVVLIVLPWIYLVPWRPEWVPPTGAEFAFIVGKLSVAAVLMSAGAALMILEAVRPSAGPAERR